MISQIQMTVALAFGTVIILRFIWKVIVEWAKEKALRDFFEELCHFHEE